jgi:hypothetical protein
MCSSMRGLGSTSSSIPTSLSAPVCPRRPRSSWDWPERSRSWMSGTGDPVSAALDCQRAENERVGTECGIMDQLVVAAASSDHALLIDCRTLEMAPVGIPEGVVAVVFDTGTRRSLVESGYNERRSECIRAAAAYGVSSLGDLTPGATTRPTARSRRDRMATSTSYHHRESEGCWPMPKLSPRAGSSTCVV